MDKGKLPLDLRQKGVHCSLKRFWRIIQSERYANKTEKSMIGCKPSFMAMFLGNFYLPISTISLQYREYRFFGQGIGTLSMPGIRYESHIVTAFNLHYSTKMRRVPSLLRTKTIGGAHSVCAGSIASMASLRSISCFSNSLFWTGSKRSRLDGPAVRLIAFDSVPHRLHGRAVAIAPA